MKCPECDLPMYELPFKPGVNGGLSKCPRCGYTETTEGTGYAVSQRNELDGSAAVSTPASNPTMQSKPSVDPFSDIQL